MTEDPDARRGRRADRAGARGSLLRDEPTSRSSASARPVPRPCQRSSGTSPDLVFLDIQMPELDGFEVARALGADRVPAVVFVTAYDEYALARVRDSRARLPAEAVQRRSGSSRRSRTRASSSPSARPPTTSVAQLLAPASRNTAAQDRRDRLVVKSSGRVYFVRTAEIDWCEAAGNYVRLHVGAADAPGARHDEPPRIAARSRTSSSASTGRRSSTSSGSRSCARRSTVSTSSRCADGTRLTLSRGYRDALQARLKST